jgi:glycine cleavage system transcriptional repressor
VGKRYLAIQAIGKDEPGLVAAITAVVSERFGCNIEGSTMSIVGGHFACTLIASGTTSIDDAAVKEALQEEARGLQLNVSPLAEGDFRRAWRDATHEVLVSSVERRGLVHELSRILSERKVNISYLSSSSSPQKNRCTVMIAGHLPEGLGSRRLEMLLQDKIPGKPGVQVTPIRSSRP